MGGWDLEKSGLAQPLHQGPVFERLNGKWVEKCPLETNFKANNIIYLNTIDIYP